MLPTKRGLSVILVGAVLYGLAWVTGIGWFYVTDSIVWAIVLVNLLLPPLNVLGLSARRRLTSPTGSGAPEVHEDDFAGVEIDLRNRSPLPKFLVTVQDRCPLAAPGDEIQGVFVGSIGPRSALTVAYRVECYRRGVYGFGPVRVQTSAPFGLFRAGRTVKAPLDATVYPKVLPIEAPANEGPLQGHLPMAGTPGQSGEVRGSREYESTDSPRSIHWRNSARQGQLMVREFDRFPQGEVRVAFNPQVDVGEGRDTTLEYAIKIAAALGRRSFQEGRPFRLWPEGRSGSLASWHSVLEHLARLRPGPDPSIRQMLGQGRLPGVSVVVVSAADGPTLRLLLRQRSGPGTPTVVLLHGFDGREDAAAREALARGGVSVIACAPGRLLDAMEELGALLAAPPARPARPRRHLAGAVRPA